MDSKYAQYKAKADAKYLRLRTKELRKLNPFKFYSDRVARLQAQAELNAIDSLLLHPN